MSSISDKMDYLKETKSAIRDAIEDKGVTVLDSDTFRSYAEKIASIDGSGSSGSNIVLVDLLNFDGMQFAQEEVEKLAPIIESYIAMQEDDTDENYEAFLAAVDKCIFTREGVKFNFEEIDTTNKKMIFYTTSVYHSLTATLKLSMSYVLDSNNKVTKIRLPQTTIISGPQALAINNTYGVPVFLPIDNERTWTPTKDYSPATKKYVDDAKEVYIGTEEPTGNEDIWINPDEPINVLGTEVVNSLDGNETNMAPSVAAVKQLNTYSTDEIVVGTWMGKPLYRVSRELTTPSTAGSFKTIHTFSNFNFNKIINLQATIMVLYENTNTVCYQLSYDENDTAHYAWAALHKGTGLFQMKVGTELINSPVYLTVYYTKTTD